MSRFNIKKAQSGLEGWSGEQKILAEQGEVFKTPDGQIQKISNNAPSHDDEMRINKFGITGANKGEGGVEIEADSVLSDSQRQVNNGKRKDNIKEQIVKIKPIEGESIAGQLGLDIKLKKSISPSQLFLEIQKVKDKQVLKILGKSKNFINNRESANSNNINRSQISALPTDEEIYDAIFDYVENKKDESGIDFNEEVQAQYGEINTLEDGYFDNPLRNMINKIKNTPLYQDWKKIDNQYPTAKDKLSALTALTALAPNPYFKYGSLAINTGLDLIGNEMNDKVDLASNIMQIAGKKHQLPLRIGGQILGTSMDIINPSDDKFKVKKKQYGGSNNSLLSSLNLIPKGQYGQSTYVQKPYSPFQIQKNQKEILAEELKKRQTYLSPKKQNNPNREYWERENLKKEANERINTRQDQTNMLGLALSPVPVIGEVYNSGNTIANLLVDVAQGEYEDAGLSVADLALSKLPFRKSALQKLEKSSLYHNVPENLENYFSNVSNNIKKEAPTIYKKLDPFYQKRKEIELKNANDWAEMWYNHPHTLEKLDNLEKERANEINMEKFIILKKPNEWSNIKERIKNKEYLSRFLTPKEKIKNFIFGKKHIHDDNYGISGYGIIENQPKTKRVNLVDKYSPDVLSTAIHEGNHGVTDGNEHIPKSIMKQIASVFGEIGTPYFTTSYDEYLKDPTEVYARIQELRRYMGLKPDQHINSKDIDNIISEGLKDKTPVDKRFFELIKDPSSLKNLMNVLPATLLPIAVSKTQEQKQYGGESSILKQLQLL